MVLVDSSVLLDVITDDPDWVEWSAAQLVRRVDRGGVAINPIVYAEVSIVYAEAGELDRLLAGLELARLDLPWDAAFLAGKAFVAYRRRGGARSAPLPDFYIGAHALVAGIPLLTRDAARYRTYFPKLKLISPASRKSPRGSSRGIDTDVPRERVRK